MIWFVAFTFLCLIVFSRAERLVRPGLHHDDEIPELLRTVTPVRHKLFCGTALLAAVTTVIAMLARAFPGTLPDAVAITIFALIGVDILAMDFIQQRGWIVLGTACDLSDLIFGMTPCKDEHQKYVKWQCLFRLSAILALFGAVGAAGCA